MEFFTERQLEGLLEEEARRLEDERGQSFTISMRKLYWRSYDAISNLHDMTTEEALLRRSKIWSARAGMSVERQFESSVWSMHDWLHNKVGVDTGVQVPPRPPSYWPLTSPSPETD